MPGSTAAESLIPEYPFTSLSSIAGRVSQVLPTGQDIDSVDGEGLVQILEDGGLSAPLVYGSMVVGMVVVWRRAPVVECTNQDTPITTKQDDWSRTAGPLLRNVAKTLSVWSRAWGEYVSILA